ncbi:MAG: trypsin-like peptidase domain-containing protein [Acidimicrobiia bacterium]|nr:trypsin-like peptidase domain-containing protein [Acidimicrobiia bacterium]
MNRTGKRALAFALPLALALAACGGGDDDAEPEETDPPVTTGDGTDTTKAPVTTTAAPTTAAPTTAAATTMPPPTTTPGISSFQDVQPAVIQIEARGSFRDPEIGFASNAGRGSGFIISPDGLAVTNNHVVTGAATLEVFVGGDTTESYNATVLGVSECNDLALIDINESEPLPTLEWYDGEITVGMDVYAAGFPLGDPQFTLTRGIVAKAEAGGDLTGTSSIDHTLEHDANIQPGNSGGPLVNQDGQVVAINYAGGAVATTTAQFYAIASDLAQPVIERLHGGDFESLGVNGWARFDEQLGIAGIWVAGVEPGSPASEAEILPGDVITAMNGLPIAQDGTFKDYCDVIRTAGEGSPIKVDVLRYDTSEVLRGELNGDQPIELAFSFADEVGEDVGDDGDGGQEPADPADYENIVDDSATISVDVPVAWADRITAPLGSGEPRLTASTDANAFNTGFEVPGLELTARAFEPDVDSALGRFNFRDSCTEGDIFDYSDAVFTGKYQLWLDCGGTPNDIVTLVANPPDSSYTMVMFVQVVTDADLEALDRAFATFNFAQ